LTTPISKKTSISVRRHLIFKLLGINILIIAFVLVILWFAIDTLAAGYFVTLMEKYHISPEPAHAMFVGSIHRYLIWAALGALVLAVALSFALTRRALGPLTRMNAVTREIAGGNYSVRVPVKTADEVGQLAEAFNRMAESLSAIENLRRTLMIDVAHELRTPLTNIRGYLEALNDGVLPPSRKIFSMLHTETMRLVHLVEDVLQLAKADAAHGSIVKRPADMHAMIIKALEAFENTSSVKKISIKIDPPGFHLAVPVDRRRFPRVLRNLSENAVKYAPEDSLVQVRLEADADVVRVVYSNEAPALRQVDLPYIFERFYRGEKSRSRSHGGAGIGLAIVKELIEAHGGSVFAQLRKGRIHVGFTLPAK
jgi:signal transduction histidine kinase